MLVTVTYRYILTSGNWVVKGWVIKWPVKLRTFFYVFFTFFSKSKKTWLFTFFLSGWPRFLEHWCEQKPMKNLGENGAWAYTGTAQSCSITRSWDNRGYSKNFGSLWIRPRSLFSKLLMDFCSDGSCECIPPNLTKKTASHGLLCDSSAVLLQRRIREGW